MEHYCKDTRKGIFCFVTDKCLKALMWFLRKDTLFFQTLLQPVDSIKLPQVFCLVVKSQILCISEDIHKLLFKKKKKRELGVGFIIPPPKLISGFRNKKPKNPLLSLTRGTPARLGSDESDESHFSPKHHIPFHGTYSFVGTEDSSNMSSFQKKPVAFLLRILDSGIILVQSNINKCYRTNL